jgi:hypothetical protein
MIHKVYWCKDCNAATMDNIECIVCSKEQLQIGWVETNGTGEGNEQEDKG